MPIDAIFTRARRAPERVALIQRGEAWSYGAFARAIAQARSQLEGAGFRPGGLVAMAVDRPIDAWAASFALRSLGITTAMTERNMDLPSLDFRNVSGVVVRLRQALGGGRGLRPRGPMPDRTPSRRAPFRPGAGSRSRLRPSWRSTAWPGHVILTSGTTGAYKKVLRSPRVDEEMVRSLAAFLAMTESSVVYVGNFPIWTAGGFRWPRATWSVGGTVMYETRQVVLAVRRARVDARLRHARHSRRAARCARRGDPPATTR